MAFIVAGFLTFMFGTTAAAVTGIVHPILVAMLGFGVIVVGGVVLAWSDMTSVPTDATVSRPAGTPVAVTCPNCGAAPRSVDRDGIGFCDYCGTRFLLS